MLIRNQEVRLLPSAPEFAKDGTWPPVVTEWLPLRWELFEAETSKLTELSAGLVYQLLAYSRAHTADDPLLREDALRSDFLWESVFRGAATSVHLWLTADADLSVELRRLVHAVRWQRKDPVTRLPPGSTHEMAHSINTGLSVERSQTLAASLGLSIGAKVAAFQAKISSQLEQQFGFKLDITAQEEKHTKLTLTNQSDNHSRLFALWHVDHRITVDALEAEPAWSIKAHSSDGLYTTWTPRGEVEFVTTDEPFVTFMDIGGS